MEKITIYTKVKDVISWWFFSWFFGISLAVFTFIIWFQNLSLLFFVWFESGATIWTKFSLTFYLYLGIGTNFTLTAAIYTLLIALLSGINVGLLAVYIKKSQSPKNISTKTSLVQLGAFISAIFGIGCASCGSIILTTLLLQFGAGGLIFLLPLRGEEFGWLAVALLLYSVFLLWRKLNQYFVCL